MSHGLTLRSTQTTVILRSLAPLQRYQLTQPPFFKTAFNSAFLFSNFLTLSCAACIFSNRCVALCFVGLGPAKRFQLPWSNEAISLSAMSSDSQDLTMVSAASTSLVLNARSWVAWKIGSRRNKVRLIGGELDYKEI